MLARVSQLALFLELVSCISIPNQGNSLNLTPAPHHVAVSKHHRREAHSLRSFNKHSNSTLIRPTNSNLQYAVEVKFNGVPLYLLLDTGSSDTWVFGRDFQCLSNTSCNTGPRYIGEIDTIPGETFNMVYGNLENVTGEVGYADVSVAGLSVENQEVSVLTEGFWQGDGVLSGVLGVGSSGLTNVFQEPNPADLLPYSPVFESMYNRTGQIDPVFSLALQRGDDAGYLAFGGLPPVDFELDFASTKIVGVPYGTQGKEREFYAIENSGFELNGKTHNSSFRAVVDSGTYTNRFPTAVADKINAAL
jgi:aspergillopepsin I